jgi:translation elongation factor EF-G
VIENQLVGSNIPPEFGPAIEKGFREACEEGPLLGHPVQGVRIVFNDGASHVVDSNEQAFRAAAKGAFVQGEHLHFTRVRWAPLTRVAVQGSRPPTQLCSSPS